MKIILQLRTLPTTVVGGGSTGVEFAGTLAELIYGHMKRDYRNLDFGKVKVILLEAAGKLLPNQVLILHHSRSYDLTILHKCGIVFL